MAGSWHEMLQGDQTLQEVLDASSFDSRSFSQWVSDELTARNMKKNAVVRRSCLNQTFAYQIMAGMRNPSRDKLIQLCFGMRLDETDSCEMLERGGMSALRVYNRRDAVVAYCLNRGLEVSTCDDLLWGMGEKTLTGVPRS